ncbi:GyrI-like domain-containing protein [Heyndrickxia coagulans]|uniref:GyrI-like domain-containing protein n=1 Tax=Heyndrickxia coagulans TaxID=1398 RepID=UPI001F38E8E0|nr:GyrI-like domain-containing protein [Heyndrickxia coagulans]
MCSLEIQIVQKHAFNAVGSKWTGTFEQAANGDIKRFFHQFKQKMGKIRHCTDPSVVIGLSYHAQDDEGLFSFYLVREVAYIEAVPEGMTALTVPSYTFAAAKYKGEDVQKAYAELYKWIRKNGYTVFQGQLEHREDYPATYEPLSDEPELTIYIPLYIE